MPIPRHTACNTRQVPNPRASTAFAEVPRAANLNGLTPSVSDSFPKTRPCLKFPVIPVAEPRKGVVAGAADVGLTTSLANGTAEPRIASKMGMANEWVEYVPASKVGFGE
jgi:hypothetical protein